MIQRIKSFLQESKQEFKQVNWPNFSETRYLTLVVIGLSILTAVFLGFLDFIFSLILKQLL